MSKEEPQGYSKAVQTNLKKDPDYYKKIGSKGGKNSTHRPMRDPDYARKLVNLRWAKYRKNKADKDKEK